MLRTAQTANTVIAKLRRAAGIRIILAFGFCWPSLIWPQPPANLAKRVAARESESERARQHYTYRQTVVVEELDHKGMKTGDYREVRDVIFSPEGERAEQFIVRPVNFLKRLILTDEDFRDIREVQPFLFTPEQLWIYETRFRGEETIDEVDCYVLQVRPRQILDGQRLFDGVFWVSKQDSSIVRSEGKAVPEIRRRKSENLFPRFTTLRVPVDGKYWFPAHTHADDLLQFSTGAQRIRMTIRYENYKRFGAESSVTFEGEVKKEGP